MEISMGDGTRDATVDKGGHAGAKGIGLWMLI